ncbi:hypothetical protein P2O70_04390, partial [Escherichia coli]
MKSVVNDTDGIVRVAESVIPEIKHQDEVRVKIASSGLCGSDLPRIFKNGAHYGNDSNLLIVFYVQIMPDDFVMQLHR